MRSFFPNPFNWLGYIVTTILMVVTVCGFSNAFAGHTAAFMIVAVFVYASGNMITQVMATVRRNAVPLYENDLISYAHLKLYLSEAKVKPRRRVLGYAFIGALAFAGVAPVYTSVHLMSMQFAWTVLLCVMFNYILALIAHVIGVKVFIGINDEVCRMLSSSK